LSQVVRSRSKSAGFTLLEVLISIAVMGILLVLLSQGLHFGLRAVRLQAQARDGAGELLGVDQSLRRLIALADPGIYPKAASLRGDASAVSLVTQLPGEGDGQRADVTLMVSNRQLVLRWVPHTHVETSASRPVLRETVLLGGIERMDLAYMGVGSVWLPGWDADALPTLVRITLIFSQSSRRRWPPMVVAPLRHPVEG
jgi:prepilin-type N-terminal cleavage/methylation domain-containing protein